MGCDIHAYIEYKYDKDSNYWNAFGGQFRFGRSYDMFAKMAGVRSYGSITPITEPRGMPEHPAWHSKMDNQLFVTDSDEHEEGTCPRSLAERWVAIGAGKYIDEDKTYVTHPDCHSNSWLTTEEFAKAFKKTDPGPEYKAALAAMRSFEKSGYEARLVFWFDN